MNAPLDTLPVKQTHRPTSAQEVSQIVAECHNSETPLYPCGGGTSLAFGVPAKAQGEGLVLTGLNQVVDYPAKDLTITVQAGATLKSVTDVLRQEQQQLMLDVPCSDRATLGGILATNWNGHRRYANGTVRDQVIGIEAVDGRGEIFHGGGRVVKNVAGYDFCKLLVGSMGTLGVITQVTLKVRPIPEASYWLLIPVTSGEMADQVLDLVSISQVTPSAVQLLGGPIWDQDPILKEAFQSQKTNSPGASFVVALLIDGTQAECNFMRQQLPKELAPMGLRVSELAGDTPLVPTMVHFPDAADAPLVLKASVVPSSTVKLVQAARSLDPSVSILAQAGNGSVFLRFGQNPSKGTLSAIQVNLRPIVTACRGSLVVLSGAAAMAEATRLLVWGATDAPLSLMNSVKRKFDPKNILNRGRFVFD